jgi:dethiobiotin synthetase
MKSLFVTATGTNVGKTHTTLKLIDALAKRGLRVGVYKPIETGVEGSPADASVLLEACQAVNPDFASLTIHDITAYTFTLPAAPFCADTKQMIRLQHIVDMHDNLLKQCDILLVEGAGGLMVPITKEYMMIHLIKELDVKTLLVTPSRLGCINDTLLSIMALERFSIDYDWCVNLHEDKEKFDKATKPYYDAVFPKWWNTQEGLEKFTASLL